LRRERREEGLKVRGVGEEKRRRGSKN